MPKGRVFNIMQYEKHPKTKEKLIDEDQIKIGLAHKTIKRWAYVCHDKDIFSLEDEENNKEHKQGTPKPRHWHIVVETPTNAVEVDTVAKWFDVPMNFVDIAKGAGAFMDCVAYLTHEDAKQLALGKHHYTDDEIKSNFDFRLELLKRAERKAKYGGKELTDKEYVRSEVLLHGMSLRDVIDKYPSIYQEDFTYLEKCRLRYISNIQKPNELRMNYYVEGAGGVGKGLISRAIAKALIDPNNEIEYDDDIFFEVGANNATFEGYDGQPVIIWNDFRAGTLLGALGGRENVFNVFDTHPPKIKQNIKYGSVRLNNVVNIVNSVQSWESFIKALAGEYRDKWGNAHYAEDTSQSYRRFPFFLVLHENDYELGMNKGLFDGTREFNQYYMFKNIQGNMRNIACRCGGNKVLYNTVTKKVVAPVSYVHGQMVEKLSHEQQGTDEEILAEFSDVGTTPTPNAEVISVDSYGATRLMNELEKKR